MPDKNMLQDEPVTEITEVDVILQEIDSANRRFDRWHKRGKTVVQIYRGEGDGANPDSDKFNILWSITKTQRPFIYSKTPQPIIKRRFLEPDEPARIGAETLERSVEYSMEIENHEFDRAMQSAREDYLLPGRGTVRVIYRASFDKEERWDPIDEEIKQDEVKAFEEVWAEHVYWKDFLHSEGKSWDEVWWVAYGSYLTRADLRREFGDDIADDIPMVSELKHDMDDESYKPTYERTDCARVWEFWNKNTRKVYKVAEGYDQFLEDPVDDPLNLEGFFDCPEPIYMNRTTGSLEPVPEYKMYEHQAAELNTLTARISNLTTALRLAGAYDSQFAPELGDIVHGSENTLVPLDNYITLAQSGGLKGAIDWLPIQEIAQVIVNLKQERMTAKADIYELVGISDIIRGVAAPRETRAAAEKRAAFAGGPLGEKQRDFEEFAKRTISIMAEVIAEHFDPKTLMMITGVQPTQQVMAGLRAAVKLLRDDPLRGFKIEVETDSTVAADAEREKRELGEFLTALSTFVQGAAGAVQAGVMPEAVAKEIVLFAVRRFRVGRQLEDKIMQMGQQQKQQQDPRVQAAQMKQQIEMEKLKLEAQELAMENAMKAEELKLKWAELEQDGKIESAKLQQKHIEALINRSTAMINASGGNVRGGD